MQYVELEQKHCAQVFANLKMVELKKIIMRKSLMEKSVSIQRQYLFSNVTKKVVGLARKIK